MQLVVQDEDGNAVASYTDFSLDLEYGDDDCDFALYIPDCILQAKQRILIDGTSFGGIIDKRCPSSSADYGDSITYEGRTVQGVFAAKVIPPPNGQSHLVVSGDANSIIGQIIELVGLSDYFEVPETDSGITITNYAFYRYVNAWMGLRMALATENARLSFTCHDGRILVEAVSVRNYGEVASEQTYFDLKMDCLPVNHLIGLGKGEGVERAVVHWYADALGNVSQTQSLFGTNENCLTYNLNSEEPDALSSKTKAKLKEYQNSSEATLTLPPGVSLDLGDRVKLSNAKFGISAETEVVQVVLKAASGVSNVEYKFGVPNYPKEEE